MLEFYGFKWSNKDNKSAPGLLELASFVTLLLPHKLDCEAHFNEFLDAFNMGSIFRYQPDKTENENNEMFQFCYTGFCPSRLSGPDCQHRDYIMLMFLNGYYDPRNTAPLLRLPNKKTKPFLSRW